MPEGHISGDLTFGVQILISPSRIAKGSTKFKGLKNVREEKEKGMYKYVSGDVKTMNDAIALQDEMREKGFKDAFVVAYLDDKRISIKEARERMRKR